MDEEAKTNIDQIENIPQEKVVVPKKPYFLVIAAFGLMIVTGFIFYKYNTGFDLFKETTPPTKIEKEEKKVKLSLKREDVNTNTSRVFITITPLKEPITLSAFEMSLISSSVNAKQIKITPNQELTKFAWQFPLTLSENSDTGSVIKISGFRLGNSPFSISEGLVLAVIEVNKNESVEFNNQNIKFFASDALTIIPFEIDND